MSTEKRTYEQRARAEATQETRRRIVEATVALHEEVGPARTTVAEIARRAGVQRLTVYNHFPEDGELFAACQARYLEEHPPPDLGDAFADPDPRARAEKALCALYETFAAREAMTAKVQRDRYALPALDELLARTLDAQMAALRDELAAGFGLRGRSARRLDAALALALDFWTWHRLRHSGLDPAAAAELMADLVAAAASS
jgi:AcrR family transcriptional regulator